MLLRASLNVGDSTGKLGRAIFCYLILLIECDIYIGLSADLGLPLFRLLRRSQIPKDPRFLQAAGKGAYAANSMIIVLLWAASWELIFVAKFCL